MIEHVLEHAAHVALWYAIFFVAIVGGYVAGWTSGRYRRYSDADPAIDGRRCRALRCGNPALDATGYCNFHTSTMQIKRRKLGLVPPAPGANHRRGAA